MVPVYLYVCLCICVSFSVFLHRALDRAPWTHSVVQIDLRTPYFVLDSESCDLGPLTWANIHFPLELLGPPLPSSYSKSPWCLWFDDVKMWGMSNKPHISASSWKLSTNYLLIHRACDVAPDCLESAVIRLAPESYRSACHHARSVYFFLNVLCVYGLMCYSVCVCVCV